ncbi:32557_t:CDS:2 [Gigaspora margarita]|uniref:32557_t:CDS:1 n=1 Tax=Gigaspora margarita TaxID=4874 RepID=A0ABM8VWJ9_GIGMA|nr:32557_t:CDS:2 [Gigaspora margarita]
MKCNKCLKIIPKGEEIRFFSKKFGSSNQYGGCYCEDSFGAMGMTVGAIIAEDEGKYICDTCLVVLRQFQKSEFLNSIKNESKRKILRIYSSRNKLEVIHAGIFDCDEDSSASYLYKQWHIGLIPIIVGLCFPFEGWLQSRLNGENYSQKYEVDMFKDKEGRTILRKKHANSTERNKKVKCCGELVNDFFVIDNCDEYSYSDYCVKCYIANRLYWNISNAGSCYVSEKIGDFMKYSYPKLLKDIKKEKRDRLITRIFLGVLMGVVILGLIMGIYRVSNLNSLKSDEKPGVVIMFVEKKRMKANKRTEDLEVLNKTTTTVKLGAKIISNSPLNLTKNTNPNLTFLPND